MNLSTGFAVVAGMALVYNIVSMIIILDRLKKKGHKINFLLIRMLGPVYVHRYRKIMFEETGTVPALFYHWLSSILIALVMAVLAIVTLE